MLSSRYLRRQLFVEHLEERDLLAVDAFLKIDSIKGSVTTPGHEGEIEILSWSWGASQGGSHAHGSGGGEGKASVHDISITKLVDSASPKLFLAAAKGTPIGKVEISLVDTDRSTPLTYYTYELKDVMITGYQLGSGGSIPIESISFNFNKVSWEYLLQDEKKVKGHAGSPDTRGADLNGDGTADPVFFNFALLTDLNHDGILDVIVARNPGNSDPVITDLNGDGRPDQVRSPNGSSLQISDLTPGADPLPQAVVADYDGDGVKDVFFALDLNHDGIADLITSVKTNPQMP